jgi:Curli production assembly/transport component CsgG
MELRRAVRIVCVVGTAVLLWSSVYADDTPQVRFGVLPFVDATGTGGGDSGATIGRLVQAEIVHSTELLGRVLQTGGTSPDDIDVPKAAELAQGKADIVVIGTVLQAQSETSSKGGYTPRILGQSVGANVHKAKATVELQGDLVEVSTGKRIASLRVKGEDSDTHVGATAYTNLGSISSDSNAWMDSPIGKAMQKAVAELVKRINTEAAKVKRAP